MDKITQLGRFLTDNRLEARLSAKRGAVRVVLVDELGDCHVGEALCLSDALSAALDRWAASAPRGRMASA